MYTYNSKLILHRENNVFSLIRTEVRFFKLNIYIYLFTIFAVISPIGDSAFERVVSPSVNFAIPFSSFQAMACIPIRLSSTLQIVDAAKLRLARLMRKITNPTSAVSRAKLFDIA